ncbi:MAG: hypothetical protein PHI63_06055 [Patescibacteria group bacterium]|nr:hypothetical protein [Patescibacteria group bacterium]
MHPELQQYIQKNSHAGVSAEEIRKALVAAGWDSKEIDAAFSRPLHQKKPAFHASFLIIFSIAVLALGAVIGGIIFFSKLTRVVSPPQTTATSTPTPSLTATPSPLPTAQPTPDLTACERMAPDSSQQYDCYREAAVAAEDPAICDAPTISGWKPMCMLAVAEVSTDETVCDYFKVHYTGFMEHCIANVAIVNRDTTRCSAIQDKLWHDECYQKVAIALNQPELCAPIIDEKDRDTCVSKIARTKLDAQICESIADAERRATCQRAVNSDY